MPYNPRVPVRCRLIKSLEGAHFEARPASGNYRGRPARDFKRALVEFVGGTRAVVRFPHDQEFPKDGAEFDAAFDSSLFAETYAGRC